MQRRRTVAAAPARTGAAAWGAIEALLRATLERSPAIQAQALDDALRPLRGVGAPLVAAGHLDRQPLVLVAGDLHLSIGVVSGAAALTHEENLSPVPGGGSAPDDWTLYIPADHALRGPVTQAAGRSPRLSADPAPDASVDAVGARATAGAVDQAALRRLQGAP